MTTAVILIYGISVLGLVPPCLRRLSCADLHLQPECLRGRLSPGQTLMAVRRMTAADYAEAGITDPEIIARIRGHDTTGSWYDELDHDGEGSAPRCDECGDETGDCGCRDD